MIEHESNSEGVIGQARAYVGTPRKLASDQGRTIPASKFGCKFARPGLCKYTIRSLLREQEQKVSRACKEGRCSSPQEG
jgi:hypothetical protein